MKVKDIIKKLEQFENQDYEMVYNMFGEDDIRECAKDNYLGALSNEQVSKVIKYLERTADASIGISWETIIYAINTIAR